MKKYRYTGPTSGVTLAGGKEAMLFDGATVDLPPDNRYVRTLVARGHLREQPLAPDIAPGPDIILNSSEAATEGKKVKSTRNNKEGEDAS